MDQELLLNLTNGFLGLLTLVLWGLVIVGIARQLLERPRRPSPKPPLFSMPGTGGDGALHHPHGHQKPFHPRPSHRGPRHEHTLTR